MKTIRVNEHIGDGCFSTYICASCAKKLGLKEGDCLPDVETVIRKLGK